MTTTSDVKVTPGSGANVATWSITEDTETKQIQRIGVVDSTGAEVFGKMTDAADTHTDATPISFMSVIKQISASIQSAATSLAGILSGARAPAAPVASVSLESSHVLKGSAGSLYSFQVSTTSNAGWVLAIDAATAPSNGAVTPKKAWQIGSASTLGVSCNPPLSFTTGIVLCFSSTGPFTLTADATAYFSGEVK